MRASDIMTWEPITVASTSTLQEALDLMVRNDIHALPVVDGERLVGILTDRDLKMMLGPGARTLNDAELDPRLLETEVSRAMTPEVESIGPETSVSTVSRLLADLRVGALPVVDEDDVLLGIVSVTDVLVAASELFEREE